MKRDFTINFILHPIDGIMDLFFYYRVQDRRKNKKNYPRDNYDDARYYFPVFEKKIFHWNRDTYNRIPAMVPAIKVAKAPPKTARRPNAAMSLRRSGANGEMPPI